MNTPDQTPKTTPVGFAQDEIEPPYDDPSKQPKTLTKSRHIDDVFYLAGRKGNPEVDQYDLMFVCSAAEEEEMARAKKNFLGFHINQEAEYLRGGTGAIKLPASRAFIDFDNVYYTAVCKWLLPRVKRSKPPTKAMKWGLPILQDEIKRVKPKIIVCMGKPVFDLLSDVKVAFADAHGGWFWSEEYKAFLYVMYAPNTLVGKPEYYEQFRIDFEEIQRQHLRLRDGGIEEIPVRYTVIRDEQSLREWVALMQEEGNKLYAVDGEWHGRTFKDGQLRTIQFAWSESDAVVIEFRNEQNEWSFHIENEIGGPPRPTKKERQAGLSKNFAAEYGKPKLTEVDIAESTKICGEMQGMLSFQAFMNTCNVCGKEVCDHIPPATNPNRNSISPEAYAKSVAQWHFDRMQIKAPEFREELSFVTKPADKIAQYLHYGPVPPDDSPRWEEIDAGVWFKKSETLSVGFEIVEKNPNAPTLDDNPPWKCEVTEPVFETDLRQFSCTVTRNGFGTYTSVDEEITNEADAEQAVRDIAEFVATPEWIKEKNEKALAAAKLAFHGPIEDDFPEAYERKRYAYVGAILSPVMNDPETRFIGHQASADAPWLVYWLNIDTCGRFYMDTLYAQQAVDESSVLSLERGIAMRYTTLGLYNLNLNLWKRENKALWAEGYGYVPSEILLKYSALDVITPFRAAPKIRHLLEIQHLWHYYQTILNPFVTDVFTAFHMEGLPTDIKQLDEMRELYHFARERLDVKFKQRVHNEAKAKLLDCLMNLPDAPLHLFQTMQEQSGPQEALDVVKPYLDTDNVGFWSKLCQHLYDAPNFNIRSPDQMRTWLFDVHELTPIKSTNQKAKGLPSMAWEKVLELPPERQRIYTPAVDKQTLQILSDEFKTLDELLNLNAVGNVCKAFLKKAETYEDELTGETVTEENGIRAWVSSDQRLRCNFSTTETSRSRTFLPNVLNFPSYVNDRIKLTIIRVIREAHEEGDLPENLLKWVGEENIPSVRSCFRALPGQVLVESDLKTAEMFALGYISGDRDLLRILEEPDPEWAVLKPGNVGPYVRVCYAPYESTGIPFEKQNPDYIMTVWKDGKFVGKVTEDDLERNPDGSVMHRNFDIHWSVVERTYERPREEMVDKIHRNAGKVLNFCCPADAKVLTDLGSISMDLLTPTHKVWDGSNWVNHAGIIKQGIRSVFGYDGVVATPEHVVYTEELGPVSLVDAAIARLHIVRSITDSGLPAVTNGDGAYGRLERSYLERRVHSLRAAFSEVDDQLDASAGIELLLHKGTGLRQAESPLQRPSGEDAGRSLPSDGSAMPQGHALLVGELQRAWDQSVDDAGGVYSLGFGYLAEGIIPREGFRQDGQRRTLHDDQPQIGHSHGEPDEHAPVGYLHATPGQGVESKSSRADLHRENCVEQAPGGLVRGEDPSALQGLPASDVRDEGLRIEGQRRARSAGGFSADGSDGEACDGATTPRQGPCESMGGAGGEACRIAGGEGAPPTSSTPGGDLRDGCVTSDGEGWSDSGTDSGAPQPAHALKFVKTCEVYDVVNAGPNHRFTVYGRLVSNSSAYGASPASLERKIESDTGVKPEPGTGQKGLDAIAARQPRATRFLEEMAEIPGRGGYYRAASGRIRHCVVHGDSVEVGWRTRKSIESALGREFRNFPMQESVAATAARACKWALDTYKQLGLKARPVVCLYDSLVTMCPFEERFIVAHLHQVFLGDINGWEYNDHNGYRMLRYGIDTEFNDRWSTNVKSYQKKMEDPNLHPTPENLKWIMDIANWDLVVS